MSAKKAAPVELLKENAGEEARLKKRLEVVDPTVKLPKSMNRFTGPRTCSVEDDTDSGLMVADEPTSEAKSPVAALTFELVKLMELELRLAPPERERLPLRLRA